MGKAANKEGEIAPIEKSHKPSKLPTWDELAARFSQLEPALQFSRIDGQTGAAGEHWRIAGAPARDHFSARRRVTDPLSNACFSGFDRRPRKDPMSFDRLLRAPCSVDRLARLVRLRCKPGQGCVALGLWKLRNCFDRHVKSLPIAAIFGQKLLEGGDARIVSSHKS